MWNRQISHAMSDYSKFFFLTRVVAVVWLSIKYGVISDFDWYYSY
jgi:hypothetical protein